MHGTDDANGSSRAWMAFAWVGTLSFFVAAAWYVWRIGDPMPSADNWANLDVFLRKAYYQGVGLSDFLWKRGVGDHAQPLNKALLWINARYFGLDFRLEGLFAMLLGLAAVLFLRHAAMARGRENVPLASIGAVTIAGVFFSLNSSRIYSYSMATMWFALYLGMFALVVVAWKALRGGSPLWALVLAFAFGIVADDVSYLAGASIAVPLFLYGGRVGGWRRTLTVVAYCVAGLLLSRIFYACFQGSIGGARQWQMSPAVFIDFLQSNYRDAWRWWAIPAASGFAHVGTRNALVGEDAAPWVANGLAIVVLIAHGWFWWKACSRKPDLTAFMAVAVMVFFYAHVAGILYGRVPIFGTDYMNSVRYVSFYQLGVIALLLMAVAAAGDASARDGRTAWRYAVPFVAVLALQPLIATGAFRDTGRALRYQEKKAYFIGVMAQDTPEANARCLTFKELRSICASDARKLRLAALLVNNRLSVFSPHFQRRHPRLAAAAAQAGDDGR